MAEKKRAPRPASKGGRVKWIWVYQATGEPVFVWKPLITRSPEWWGREMMLGDTDYSDCIAQVVLE